MRRNPRSEERARGLKGRMEFDGEVGCVFL